MRKLLTILAAVTLVFSVMGTATAQEDPNAEVRHLDLDASGEAEDVDSGDTFDAEVNVTGNVTVRESGEGVDETAQTDGPTVDAEITVGDTTYTIPVSVVGEGTSFEQAGIFDGQAWRLHIQGEDFSSGRDGSGASFSGNVTLVGNDGDFVAFGEGTLTVRDQSDTTTYDLEYTGTATFE